MYNKEKRDKLSRLMSYILRHNPSEFGLVLNAEGFVDLDDLIQATKQKKQWSDVTIEDVEQVTRECNKQRYEIVGNKIRARYGHSAQKIVYPKGIPPKILYHGTYEGAIEGIFEKGILKMEREDVHLSETTHFAELAGKRRGKLVILEVDTEKVMEKGYEFGYAGGEVWLVEHVPVGTFQIKK